MKATAKRGKKKSTKTAKETARGTGKATNRPSKTASYPVAETLRWVADGQKLLTKWGAIKSPGAKRIANAVGKVLSVLEALTELRKA